MAKLIHLMDIFLKIVKKRTLFNVLFLPLWRSLRVLFNKIIWKSIFVIYILLLLNFVVIKFDGNINHLIDTIQTNYNRGPGINFVPFRTIETYISDMDYSVAFINILGNIIPFIPLGFLIPIVFPSQRNIIKTMTNCLLMICSIEILQLIFFLGSCDIDDVILNQISCVIGFILFIIYRNVFKEV